MLEAEQWNEALLALTPIANPESKFTGTDRAKMFYYQGYIYFSMEDYGRAETAYKNLIAEPESNDQERLGALYSLSQLAYIDENYRKSIDYLLQWFDLEEVPRSDAYALLSMTYYQLEDFVSSQQNIDIAIEIEEDRDIPIKVEVLD